MIKYASAFASILVAAGVSISGFADNSEVLDDHQASLHQEATTDVGPVLEKLDEDKDGYIGKQEAVQLEGLSTVFDEVDANKDAKVDAAELSKFLAPSTK